MAKQRGAKTELSGTEQRIARALAGRVVAHQRSGAAVPADVAGAAQAALRGSATKRDMQALQSYHGIGRGTGRAKQAIGAARRGIGQATAFAQNVQAAAEGNAGATAGLIRQATDGAANFLKNNRAAAIKFGEKIAGAVGANPALASKVVYGIGRIAGVGGVVAGAAMAADYVVGKIGEAWTGGASAGSRMAGLAREMETDPRIADKVIARARELANSQHFLERGGVMDVLTGGAITGRREIEAADYAQEFARTMLARRGAGSAVGGLDRGEAVRIAAMTHGIKAADVTEQQINEIQDAAGGRRVGQDRVTFERSYRLRNGGYWGNLIADATGWDAAEIRMAYEKQQQRDIEAAREQPARAERARWDKMTAAERFAVNLDMQRASAEGNSFRARHASAIPD